MCKEIAVSVHRFRALGFQVEGNCNNSPPDLNRGANRFGNMRPLQRGGEHRHRRPSGYDAHRSGDLFRSGCHRQPKRGSRAGPGPQLLTGPAYHVFLVQHPVTFEELEWFLTFQKDFNKIGGRTRRGPLRGSEPKCRNRCHCLYQS